MERKTCTLFIALMLMNLFPSCITISNLSNSPNAFVITGSGNLVPNYEAKNEKSLFIANEFDNLSKKLSNIERELKLLKVSTSISDKAIASSHYKNAIESLQIVSNEISTKRPNRNTIKKTINPEVTKLLSSYSKLLALNKGLTYSDLAPKTQQFWNAFFENNEVQYNNTLTNESKLSTLFDLHQLRIIGNNYESCSWTNGEFDRCMNLPSNKLSILNQIPNIKELTFSNIQLSNLRGFDHTPLIEELYLDCNNLTSINGIEPLTELKVLTIRENNLTNLNGLEHLENLQTLHCTGNEINDITAIIELRKRFPNTLKTFSINVKYLSKQQLNELNSLFTQQNSNGHERIYHL